MDFPEINPKIHLDDNAGQYTMGYCDNIENHGLIEKMNKQIERLEQRVTYLEQAAQKKNMLKQIWQKLKKLPMIRTRF